MEEQTFYITDYCTVEAGQVRVNGDLRYSMDESEVGDMALFLKRIYKDQAVDYPKFFKMDTLSKLAFIGAELLLPKRESSEPCFDTALILSNSTSSLDTDIKHQEAISNPAAFYPSPAVFVYTLANICLAEISIRHRLQGENAFFIAPAFDAPSMHAYGNYLLQTRRAERVVSGWVDYLNGTYKLVLYVVEKHGHVPHTIENSKHLF